MMEKHFGSIIQNVQINGFKGNFMYKSTLLSFSLLIFLCGTSCTSDPLEFSVHQEGAFLVPAETYIKTLWKGDPKASYYMIMWVEMAPDDITVKSSITSKRKVFKPSFTFEKKLKPNKIYEYIIGYFDKNNDMFFSEDLILYTHPVTEEVLTKSLGWVPKKNSSVDER